MKDIRRQIALTLALHVVIGLMSCCSCSQHNNDNTPDIDKEEDTLVVDSSRYALAYTTTADGSKLFKAEQLELGGASSMSPYVVKLTDESYQTIDGFGAAVTVSSCYNLLKMPSNKRAQILKQVFDPEGVGSSLVRVCIGGSDFSWDYGDSGISSDGRYTWCDTEGMENFAAHPMDVKYLVPILKEIYAINPDVKIIGSPWTAPRWMKTSASQNWTGGHLDPAHYADYGEYFAKWIQYMQDQGFTVAAVTPQNEPLNAGNSMSMLMYWDECRDFIKNGLGPALRNAGLDTKILIFDHNYNYDNISSQQDYPLNVYADAEAAAYIDGSAWHNYGGSVTTLDKIVEKAPTKSIYFTEASIGTWNYTFDGCLINDFKSIFLETLSRGCKGVTLWNLMLDDRRGPYTNAGGSCETCYGALVLLSSDYSTVKPYSHYYNFAHCSRVIRPGAVRVGTEGYTVSGVTYQAYRNTDGSYGAIVLNENSAEQQLVFSSGEHTVRYTCPAKSIVSLIWKY